MEKKHVVLVVDDQPQNIELLEAYLLPQGYEIITAVDGQQAFEKLSDYHIDLILLDVIMSGMDGFEITRKIRQHTTHRQLPIILVTALRDAEYRIKGIEAGCDDFISKPIDKMELLARVRSLLKVKAYNDLMIQYRIDLEYEVNQRTIELKQALEKLNKASLDTIYRLSIAAEYRDDLTGAHVQRVGRYAAAVAQQIGLNPSDVDSILHAAPMHDLGKIGIPDQILLKKGKLDPTEWDIMKKHTEIGAIILKGSDAEYISIGESIALCHHERWDGSGYPNGLKGKHIPIAARITAIADVFDALNSKRPYKEAFSLEKALSIIRQSSGSHFDPDVVNAFFEIFAINKYYDYEIDNDYNELKILLNQYQNKL